MFLTIIKAMANLACFVGSEVIVGGIVKNAAIRNTNKVLNACSHVATVCVAGVLGTAAGKYAEESIDEIANGINKLSGKAGDANGAAQKQSE